VALHALGWGIKDWWIVTVNLMCHGEMCNVLQTTYRKVTEDFPCTSEPALTNSLDTVVPG